MNKGRGVICTKDLKSGDLVCEYKGELLGAKITKDRERIYNQTPEVGSYMYDLDFGAKRMCIDSTKEDGNCGRLLNHILHVDNVTPIQISVGKRPCLLLVAKALIPAGEELTYNYGARDEEIPWTLE